MTSADEVATGVMGSICALMRSQIFGSGSTGSTIRCNSPSRHSQTLTMLRNWWPTSSRPLARARSSAPSLPSTYPPPPNLPTPPLTPPHLPPPPPTHPPPPPPSHPPYHPLP